MATGWSTAALAAQVNAVGNSSTATWVAAYTDDACTIEVTGGPYTRVEGTWPITSDDDTTTPEVELNIPAATTVRGIARLTTASGGTPYVAKTVSPPESFGSAGKLFVTNHLQAVVEPS